VDICKGGTLRAGRPAELTGDVGGRSIDVMARVGWETRHRGLILTAAVVVPLLASALMSTFRNNLENTNAALVLVLLVVAAASAGIRLAGVFAALSSAVWFDFFLTAPYLAFAIIDRADIETTLLLVLVGLAVSDIAYWGRTQQAEASRHEGFLAGVIEAAGVVAAGDSPTETLVDRSCGTSNSRDPELGSLCLQVHDQQRPAGPAVERNSRPAWENA